MQRHEIADIQHLLNVTGFRPKNHTLSVDGVSGPATRRAVAQFQASYAGGSKGKRAMLPITGNPGRRVLNRLIRLNDEGLLSPHFTVAEFASSDTGEVSVSRYLLLGLERLRHRLGAPIQVVSGFRTPARNDAVGGASNSMHTYGSTHKALAHGVRYAGAAADLRLTPGLTVDLVRSVGMFSGIGSQGSTAGTARVRHVDVRHLTPHSGGRTPHSPARWYYG